MEKEMNQFDIKDLIHNKRVSLALWLLGAFVANITFPTIMGYMGVLTKKSIIPTSSIYFESSSEGNFSFNGLNPRSKFIWEKDETYLANLNIKYERLSFRRKIHVKSRSLIIVTLSAGCFIHQNRTCTGNKSSPGNTGMVMTRISVNNQESARDNNVFNQSFAFPIYSSTIYMGMLEEGSYPLQAEGIFTANSGDPKAKIAVMIIQYEDVPYDKLMKLRANGHKTITNGFTDVGNLKPIEPVIKQLKQSNFNKIKHTSTVSREG